VGSPVPLRSRRQGSFATTSTAWERHGLLVELEDGRYKRSSSPGNHEARAPPGLARFSRLVPRRIGKLLLAGPMNRTELRRTSLPPTRR